MNPSIPILSVSQLNDYVKGLIDASTFLSRVHIRGEITNFTNHYKTGHFYFTLKDDRSLLKVVMFASNASKIRFTPENNMEVLVTGRISVFPRDGVYQLYAESMEPLGKGALYAAFEQLKARLEAKGYFDPAHKKPLPPFPKKIGIITSPIGAAVADMKNILSRRYPLIEIVIYPALVQGEGAPQDLCRGLEYFDACGDIDIILLGRGGGSLEDLWAFNDERLARAVYLCRTPVISAVGHETDFTICDFVADLRAPTPSAAAELAVPEKNDLLAALEAYSVRLQNAAHRLTERKRDALAALSGKKCFTSPLYLTERLNDELAALDRRISVSTEHKLASDKQRLAAVSARLAALNPMNVLARGYAAVFDENRNVIDTVQKVSVQDKLTLSLSDGTLDVTVDAIRKSSDL